MKKQKINSVLIIIIFSFIMLVTSNALLANNKKCKKNHNRKVQKVVKVPHGNRIIKCGKTKYNYHKGIYYRKINNGHCIVKAPVGIRIKTLPMGYKTVFIGIRKYYYYHNTYYFYDFRNKVYIVIEKPVEV